MAFQGVRKFQICERNLCSKVFKKHLSFSLTDPCLLTFSFKQNNNKHPQENVQPIVFVSLGSEGRLFSFSVASVSLIFAFSLRGLHGDGPEGFCHLHLAPERSAGDFRSFNGLVGRAPRGPFNTSYPWLHLLGVVNGLHCGLRRFVGGCSLEICG